MTSLRNNVLLVLLIAGAILVFFLIAGGFRKVNSQQQPILEKVDYEKTYSSGSGANFRIAESREPNHGETLLYIDTRLPTNGKKQTSYIELIVVRQDGFDQKKDVFRNFTPVESASNTRVCLAAVIRLEAVRQGLRNVQVVVWPSEGQTWATANGLNGFTHRVISVE